ncbi:hypothetical protein GOV11_00975 [Candidatus Woesearchaeota archaeon]|nr:hypothetical protein [Candidatus Woesearchaeota archaeon]
MEMKYRYDKKSLVSLPGRTFSKVLVIGGRRRLGKQFEGRDFGSGELWIKAFNQGRGR